MVTWTKKWLTGLALVLFIGVLSSCLRPSDADGQGEESFQSNLDLDYGPRSLDWKEGETYEELIFGKPNKFQIRNSLPVFEDDVVLHPEAFSTPALRKSFGVGVKPAHEKYTGRHWPNKTIPYVFAPDLNPTKRQWAMEAIQEFNSRTVLTLKPRTDEPRYVTFVNTGCQSYVGKVNFPQQIWIGSCTQMGSVIHEIGHAAGLWHEHQRLDRDEHLIVNPILLPSVNYSKADELDGDEVRDYGNFNWQSIMLYSSDGSMTKLDGSSFAAQRNSLSFGDIQAIEEMYNRCPVADIGPDQTVSTGEYFALHADGYDLDNDHLDFDFKQISGPPIFAFQPDRSTFELELNQPGTFHFELTLADNYCSGRDTMALTVSGATRSLHFNRTQQVAVIPHDSSLDLGQGDFTFEIWVRPQISQYQFATFLSNRSGANGFLFAMKWGMPYIQLGGWNLADAGVKISDNQPYHVAVTRVGSSVTYWIDGQAVKTITADWIDGRNISNAHALWMGLDDPSQHNTSYNGSMDRVRIWNVGRSAFEIQATANQELSGNVPGLVAEWRFDETGGQAIYDWGKSGLHGHLGTSPSVDSRDPVRVSN